MENIESFKMNIIKLWFYYEGELVRGQGELIWDTKEGCTINADITPLKNKYFNIPREYVISKEDYIYVKMMFGENKYGTLPLAMIDKYEAMQMKMSSKVSIQCARLILVDKNIQGHNCDCARGNAIYKTHNAFYFPAYYENNKINTNCISYNLKLTNRGNEIVGNCVGRSAMEFSWNMNRNDCSRKAMWCYADAIQDALSITYGETIFLIKREIYIGKYKITELRKQYGTSSLIFPLINWQNYFTKDVFNKLIDSLLKNDQTTTIIKQIYDKVLSATQINDSQAKELLISTAIEAFTRTYYNIPFKKGKKYTPYKDYDKFVKGINDGNKDYFSSIKQTYENMRNRNAHPDWLTSREGALSKAVLEEQFDDIKNMCRFYGYVIMALVGVCDISPQHPSKIKDSNAAISFGPTIQGVLTQEEWDNLKNDNHV